MWRRVIWYMSTELSAKCAAPFFRVDDGGGWFLRNVGSCVINYMT